MHGDVGTLKHCSSNPLHIVMIRFSSLGDIVLHSSCAQAIKERWGAAVHLSLFTSRPLAPLMEGTPWIDEVHAFDRQRGVAALLTQVKEIHRRRKIDFFLDLHGTLRSLLIRYAFWRVPRLYVDKRSAERWLLTWGKLDLLSGQYRNNRPRGWGEALLRRIPRDFAQVFQYSTKFLAERSQLSFCRWTFGAQGPELLASWGVRPPFIVVAPSASFEQKRWPAQSYRDFLSRGPGAPPTGIVPICHHRGPR